MRSKLLIILLLFAVVTTQSGCFVSLFRLGKAKQKIEVQNPNEGAVVLHEDDTLKQTHIKIPKAYEVDQFLVKQPGYKDRRYTFTLNKRSPFMLATLLDFVPFIFAGKIWPPDPVDPQWVIDNKTTFLSFLALGALYDWRTNKMFRYDVHHVLPKLERIIERSEDERYIRVLWDSTRMKYSKFGYTQKRRVDANFKRRDTVVVENTLRVDTSLIAHSFRYTDMEGVLSKFKYIDTVSSVFNVRGRTLFLDPKFEMVLVNKLVLHVGTTYYDKRYATNNVRSVTTRILWQIKDGFGEVIDSVRTDVTSDYFIWESKQEMADSMCNDNLEFAFMKVQSYLKAKNLLKMDTAKKVFAPIFLEKPTPVANSIKDYYKGTVAVSLEDGHGSGVIVSKDGYLVSNWHLVVGKKEIEIVLHNGTKLKAKVVRKADAEDLVLLKVDTTGLAPLVLANMEEPELGIDIMAIGTPHELELGQSASKGIISGLRKKEGLLYLQTDASLSGGNSGGPLIDNSGRVLGIISKKLVGTGVEGIGFALNAAHVFTALGIQYK